MGPELKELESPSAGTGLETPGQVSPQRGDMGKRTNHRLRHLDRERGFKPRGKYFFTHGTSEGHENVCRHLSDSCDPGKPQAQDI